MAIGVHSQEAVKIPRGIHKKMLEAFLQAIGESVTPDFLTDSDQKRTLCHILKEIFCIFSADNSMEPGGDGLGVPLKASSSRQLLLLKPADYDFPGDRTQGALPRSARHGQGWRRPLAWEVVAESRLLLWALAKLSEPGTEAGDRALLDGTE